MEPSLQDIDFSGISLGSQMVRSKIGTGAFGTVWSSRHQTRGLGEPNACKIFVFEKASSQSKQQGLEQVQSEYEPLSKVERSLSVPRLYDLCFTDGIIRESDTGSEFPLEFIPTNGSEEPTHRLFALMFEFLNRGKVDLQFAKWAEHRYENFIECMIEIADTIHKCHSSDNILVHADIKPENLLWSANDSGVRVCLGDWGIASTLARYNILGAERGTLQYMSPECFENDENGGDFSIPRDIYAFAATLYEIITGIKAFESDPMERTTNVSDRDVYRILHSKAERPWAYPKSRLPVSAEFCEVLHRAMSIAPEARPSALDLKKELKIERSRYLDARNPRVQELDCHEIRRGLQGFQYTIHPKVRKVILKQLPVFISIELEERSDHSITLMHSAIRKYYDSSYVMLEVYGGIDYMIRIWDDPNSDRLGGLISHLSKLAARTESAGPTLFASYCDDDAIVSCRFTRNPRSGLRYSVEASLLTVQAEFRSRGYIRSAYGMRCLDRLVEDRCISGTAIPDPFSSTPGIASDTSTEDDVLTEQDGNSNDLIPCFLLIRTPKKSALHQTLPAKFKTIIEESMDEFGQPAMGRKIRLSSDILRSIAIFGLGGRIDMLPRHQESVFIEFIAQSYSEVRDVPELLLACLPDKIRDTLNTTTLLCSKRMSYMSEGVSLPQRHVNYPVRD